MKSFKNILALGALALVGFGSSALAEDATTSKSYVTFPNTVRCQACGAEYHVLARTTKDNSIQIKLEQITKSANPKTN